MAQLPAPITVTIAGTAHSLDRINQDNFVTSYLKKGSLFEVRLTVRHQYESAKGGQRQYERHNVDLQYTSFSADPSIPPTTTQVYTVLRMPRGDAVTMATDLNAALATVVSANIATILGWAS